MGTAGPDADALVQVGFWFVPFRGDSRGPPRTWAASLRPQDTELRQGPDNTRKSSLISL